MAEETKPATPIKDGPGKATPNKTATTPSAPKTAALKQGKPVKGATTGKKGARETIKEEASKASQQAADRARQYAGDGKKRATGALNDVSKLMNDAAGDVDKKFGEQYGEYARSAAGAVSGFADTIDGKDVDELLDEVRDFVRRSPAVAIGAAAAAGFVFARILKSGIDAAGEDSDFSA